MHVLLEFPRGLGNLHKLSPCQFNCSVLGVDRLLGGIFCQSCLIEPADPVILPKCDRGLKRIADLPSIPGYLRSLISFIMLFSKGKKIMLVESDLHIFVLVIPSNPVQHAFLVKATA